MRERCIKVALENTPSNVRCVRIRKDLSGLAETSGSDAGLLCASRPITRRALYVYLHECAHFVLHADGKRPRYVEEYEAEQWAHKVMRVAGIPPKADRLIRARARAFDLLICARQCPQARTGGASPYRVVSPLLD